MDKVSVVKIARVLNGLVLAALVCNVVALYLVPTVVMTGREGLLEGVTGYFGSILFPGEDDIVSAIVVGSALDRKSVV